MSRITKFLLIFCFTISFPLRIISTAPSITETIYMLGAEKDLIAVSKFCDYPSQAKKLQNIGGYLDFNRESILLLKPDIVLVIRSNINLINFLKENNIKYLAFDNQSIEGIYDMVSVLGKTTLKQKQAEKIVYGLRNEVSSIKKRNDNTRKIKALVVFEQVIQGGKAHGLYIMGNDSFYETLFSTVGFTNVYTGDVKYPLISEEAVYALNPEAIIVLEDGKKSFYNNIKIKAVKDKLYFFKDEFFKRPGPRFNLIIRELEKTKITLINLPEQ